MGNARHIFLTGFMGSGKSTLGAQLSRLMKRPFVDLDREVERHDGRTVATVFEQGEDHFRKLEAAVLTAVCAATDPHVIALGGGTVCYNRNLEVVQRSGLLVYLEVSAETLFERLEGDSQRPLLKGFEGAALRERIGRLLNVREPFYRNARLTVKADRLSAQDLLQQVRNVPA